MKYYRHSSHGGFSDFYGYVKPYMIVINASQDDVPKGTTIDFLTSADRGYRVYGEKDNPYNNTVNELMELGVSYAASNLIDSSVGTALTLLEIIYNMLGSTGVHNVLGVSGPYKTATMVLYQRGYNVSNDPENSDNGWSKMGYTAYAMRTQILWKLPLSERSYTLHLSVQNIMGKWIKMFPLNNIDNYPPTQTWYSAKSMIDITIKNGQISSFNAYTKNVNSAAGNTFYTKDYTPSWVTDPDKYYAAPTLIVVATTQNDVPVIIKNPNALKTT